MAASAHPLPSAQEQDRQLSQLTPIGLAASDQERLISELARFRVQIDVIASQRAAPGVTAAQFSSLQAQEAALAAATAANVGLALSQDGSALLQKWIRTHVKAHMVIVGGPMQGAMSQ